MSSARLPLLRLILAGVILPALIAASNDYLLSSLVIGWRTGRGLMVVAMAALVVEIGLMGVVCGRWIDWPLLRWILYGWCWLVVDLQVLLARQLAVENFFGGTAAFLSGSLLAAQLGLVTVWAVLGTMRWSTRWPAAFVLAAILAAPLLDLGYGGNAALFFLVQISTTAGISAMLRWNGFRLALASAPLRTGSHQPAAELATSQFGLSHMLVWTTAMALVLALVRLIGLPWDDWANARFFQSWLVFASSGVAVGMVLIVAIWAALSTACAGQRWAALLLITPAAALASGLVGWTEWLLQPRNWNLWGRQVQWFGWQFWRDYFESEQWLIAWICLAGAMLFASLLFLRATGYRLERGPGQSQGTRGKGHKGELAPALQQPPLID